MQRIGEIRFDYRALSDRIERMYGRDDFAAAMPMSPRRLERLLTGEGQFTQREIRRAAALLGIPDRAVCAYFFTQEVQKI
ncbi:MAG: DUF739 family protein [Clostridia bacterium]|nr:DUF739 family protein [Clostridia bacterium]